MDLPVEPARRGGVTIKATDVAREVGDRSKGSVDDFPDTFLVLLGDEIDGALGFPDLAINDPLDGEEGEVRVLQEYHEISEVSRLSALLQKMVLHSGAFEHHTEDFVGVGDGERLG